MSLRRRLVLGLLVIGAVLLVTNVTLAAVYRSFLIDRIDRQLVDVASRPIFHDGGGRFGPPGRGPGIKADDETLSEYFIAVESPVTGTFGKVQSAFANDAESPPKLDAADLERRADAADLGGARPFDAHAESGSGTWRLVAVHSREGLTVVGQSLSQVDATMASMRTVQAIGTMAVLASLALVFWWVLRLGLHPIEDMAETADAIAAGDLSRRVSHPSERTEAGRLGAAFNAMLERIQQAFREREASEERVRRFAADASHELRTPLTSIIGYAELYRAGALRTDDELAGAMGRMEQEGKRMAALVEDLLTLARLDQHRAPERRLVRLDELVAGAVADARAVEPGRPVSESIAPVAVEGDDAQLRQVVGNLLANVRVHTPPGTPVHVTLAPSADGKRAVLSVADEGPGMDPAVAAHVFDRFFRADAARGSGTGSTGLGLSIVQAVAAAHGGTVAVSSAPGSGTRFTVELPAVTASGRRAGLDVSRAGS
jgi:two-component system OmpR family sensor kinase